MKILIISMDDFIIQQFNLLTNLGHEVLVVHATKLVQENLIDSHICFLDFEIDEIILEKTFDRKLLKGHVKAIIVSNKLSNNEFKRLQVENPELDGFIKKPLTPSIIQGVVEDFQREYNQKMEKTKTAKCKNPEGSLLTEEINFSVKDDLHLLQDENFEEEEDISEEDNIIEHEFSDISKTNVDKNLMSDELELEDSDIDDLKLEK